MSDTAARPLARLVGRRIVLFAALAMAAQLVAVLWEYGSDPDNLGRLLLEQETAALAHGLSRQGGRLAFELPPALAARYGTEGSGYVARVRTAAGAVLFSHCDDACTAHFLPLDLNPPSFWLRRSAAGFPLSVAGGRTIELADRAVFIEIAVDRDPDGAVWGVLLSEASEHMLVPMSLTLIFVLGATLLSIRAALRPVERAAHAAERLDPLGAGPPLPTAGMPLEVARLAGAVNRSFARVRALITAQKLFTSAIAHEIRTPLAIIRLELERIDHPGARRATTELDELVGFVEQMVTLARLETTEGGFVALDLDAALGESVAALAPWVYAQGASIAFEGSDNPTVTANPVLLRDAVRNLVENAVRHGGEGVAILVASRPGPAVVVADDGPGMAAAPTDRADDGTSTADLDASSGLANAGTGGRWSKAGAVDAPGYYKPQGGLGIGIEIVRRIAALHGASFTLAPATPHGTLAVIRFTADPNAPAKPGALQTGGLPATSQTKES